MDDGVFKTSRRGLYGGRPADIQWLWDVEERGKRKDAAVRPPKHTKQEYDAPRQLLLPLSKQSR